MRFSFLALLALEVLPTLGRPKDMDDDKARTVTITAPATSAAVIPATAATPASAAQAKLSAGDAATSLQGKVKEGAATVAGVFGSLNVAVGGSQRQNIVLPANSAGALEVEYNGTAANKILVAPRMAAVAPPTGMEFVDPLTFAVTTETPAAAGDILKIDYIFTAGTRALINISAATIGKLDTATNQFATTGLGTFKVEDDENEWSLTVADLNGEWAVLVPTTALLPVTEED